MSHINQFLHMATLHQQPEEQRERSLFHGAAYAELLQKLNLTASAAHDRRTSPKSYAPSRFGAPISWPNDAPRAVALPTMRPRRP